MFDKDASGALSPEEIKEDLCFDSQVDPKEVDRIIAEFDENGDGEI
jgi:Ca2+-binding EF-hand superfamily protein